MGVSFTKPTRLNAPDSGGQSTMSFQAAHSQALKNRNGKVGMDAVSLMAKGAESKPGTFMPTGNTSVQQNPLLRGQTYRTAWASMLPKDLRGLSRLLSSFHWFVSGVVDTRFKAITMGFRFRDSVQKWVDEEAGDEKLLSKYPFKKVADDVVREFLINDVCVAFWKKGETLPAITILNSEVLEVGWDDGKPTLKLKYAAQRNLGDDAKADLGERLHKALKDGSELIIKDDDAEYGFAVMDPRGKSGEPLSRPSVSGILDDLAYLALIDFGNWNGAWKRKDILRIWHKGYEIKNGALAGQNLYAMTRKQRNAILDAAAKISGAADVALNFDIEVENHFLPDEFFGDKAEKGALRRLGNWGGWAAIVVMDSVSRSEGFHKVLDGMKRDDVLYVRSEVKSFLESIWNSEDFLGEWYGQEATPKLSPVWTMASVFSGEQINTLGRSLVENGIISPQSYRELAGFDNEEEVERLKAASADEEGYRPVFESRQGLLQPPADTSTTTE